MRLKILDYALSQSPVRPGIDLGLDKANPPRASHTTAVIPPSTNRMCPLTKDDASAARKIAAPCSSSTLPQRPAGVRAHTQAENFSSFIKAVLSSVPK